MVHTVVASRSACTNSTGLEDFDGHHHGKPVLGARRRRRPGRRQLAFIEARSAERLALLGEALGASGHEPELADLYRTLAAAEVRHRDLFVRLAFDCAPVRLRGKLRARAEVAERLQELAAVESEVVAGLPIRARIH